ncbi:MAG: germination protein YpeB [Clostridia bacterium]|nr:germination protein YpeB [Clostridia bacterium]
MDRKRLRTVSIVAAAFAVLLGAFIYQLTLAQTYRSYIVNQNARSFYDLVDSVRTIDSSLEKGIHSSSDAELIAYSSEVWREAGGAQANLSALPLSSEQTDKVAKFLSQTGDYAYMISGKAAAHEAIGEEEKKTLEQLSSYCKTLFSSLSDMEEKINRGELSLMKMRILGGSRGGDDAVSAACAPVVEQFADYPTLIYDGPFSDHLADSASVMLDAAADVDMETARQTAASAMGTDVSAVEYRGECEGRIPAYCFGADKDGAAVTCDVSRRGGYVIYMLSDRAPGEERLSPDEALSRAEEYLRGLGLSGMTPGYYMTGGGALTANFAWEQGGIIYYRDLAKVTVALDTGEVTGLDLTGYIKSHDENRAPLSASRTEEDAKSRVSARLTPTNHKLAVIPTDFGTEVFCHEFLCTNSDGRKYLVYINDETGEQQKIFMLMESENGTLAV